MPHREDEAPVRNWAPKVGRPGTSRTIYEGLQSDSQSSPLRRGTCHRGEAKGQPQANSQTLSVLPRRSTVSELIQLEYNPTIARMTGDGRKSNLIGSVLCEWFPCWATLPRVAQHAQQDFLQSLCPTGCHDPRCHTADVSLWQLDFDGMDVSPFQDM